MDLLTSVRNNLPLQEKKADENNQKDTWEEIYNSKVPPSPNTKSLTTVYYSKPGDHSSPIDTLSPQDLTDAKAYLYARCIHIYIVQLTCITRYNLIDGKSLLAEIGRCRCRSKT